MVLLPRRTGALLVALLPVALACQGDPVGDGDGSGGTTGGSAGSGGSSATGGATGGTSGTGATGGSGGGQTGPGPNGSLPSGYCCDTDLDCRFRTCLDFGGVKMCSDPCSKESSCNSAPNLTCNLSSGQCSPAGTPKCIPANQWTLGPYPTGDCCVATNDGHAGEECQGNLCMAFGALSNPFICTQACESYKDCPPKYECNTQTRFCWPLATTYTCQ